MATQFLATHFEGLPVVFVQITETFLLVLRITWIDRLCGLVVRVSGYRYRGPGFDPRRYQIF